jgi:hypothetical protein
MESQVLGGAVCGLPLRARIGYYTITIELPIKSSACAIVLAERLTPLADAPLLRDYFRRRGPKF